MIWRGENEKDGGRAIVYVTQPEPRTVKLTEEERRRTKSADDPIIEN